MKKKFSLGLIFFFFLFSCFFVSNNNAHEVIVCASLIRQLRPSEKAYDKIP